MKFGLLGRKLGHSLSKEIHGKIGDYQYDLYEREPEEVEDFIKSDIQGLNITIPYKEVTMEFVDQLSQTAEEIGCINTLVKRDGKIIGDNTDYFGFKYLLESLGEDFTKALILGDGASSNTVGKVLEDKDISYMKISRKKPPSYEDIDKFQDADLVINTTPVGMYPNNLERLVSIENLPNVKGVLDLVYNPDLTDLLFQGFIRGVPYGNGMAMLVGQAVEAKAVFFDEKADYELIESVIADMEKDRNIALIGMPGSGKTSLSKWIGKKMGRPFVDIDEEIQRREKMTIPEIFESQGEAYFREVEKEVLSNISKERGQVIATGGGIVKDPENHLALKQNAQIYHIKRDLEKLDKSGRPLSTDQSAVQKLWEERKDLYEAFADQTFENDGSIEELGDKIIQDFLSN